MKVGSIKICARNLLKFPSVFLLLFLFIFFFFCFALPRYCAMERSNFHASKDTALQSARNAMETVIANREDLIQRNLSALSVISPPSPSHSPSKMG